ncbi:MAG: hypothetical protein L3J30_08070 [Marinosulfonomonas sp.]|nr:hypothetical protein [Marinosulfonomonas sp.]
MFGPQYISKVEGSKLLVKHTTSLEDGFYPNEVDHQHVGRALRLSGSSPR